MSFLNRTRKGNTPVPAKPLVPYIEVTRQGLFFSEARLTVHPDYPYTTWRGKVLDTWYCPRPLVWRIYGDDDRAQRVARRILNRYLRRVSYRNGGAVRIEGKVK